MGKGFWAICALALLLLVLSVYLSYKEHKEWVRFAAEHNCVVVGKVSGHTSTGTGITPQGNVGTVTTYTPGKTGYKCDDGVTYWR